MFYEPYDKRPLYMRTATARTLLHSTVIMRTCWLWGSAFNGPSPTDSKSKIGSDQHSTTVSTIIEASSVPRISVESSAIQISQADPVSTWDIQGPSPISTASSTTPSPISTVDKRGLCYNNASLTNVFNGSGIRWGYDWGSGGGTALPQAFEYVPMLWGPAYAATWFSDVSTAISFGSQNVLSFNEPDIDTQSNMSAETAADYHMRYLNPLADQVRIGSPAVSNSVQKDPPQGKFWLERFFEACDGKCAVDFMAFHWYNDASELDNLRFVVEDMANLASKNNVTSLWITELGGTGSPDTIETFLSAALSYLEGIVEVERFAYFMCSNGTLLQGSALSSLGQLYYANNNAPLGKAT